MVYEVNRIVGSLLAADRELFLPSVGTIFTERRGAQRISKHKVLPPCRMVNFASQERGVSLVVEIARAASCDEARAQEVYNQWLESVKTDSGLVIAGVGMLHFKSFAMEPDFDNLLNPQGHEPLQLKFARRFDWILWLGIAAITVALGFGGYEFLMMYPEQTPTTQQTAVAVEVAQEPANPIDTVAAVAAETMAVTDLSADKNSSTTSALPAPVPDVHPTGTPNIPAKLVRGHSYVVLGVFSTPENAARAVHELSRVTPPLEGSVFAFGEKFMVSPFNAAKVSECRDFVNASKHLIPEMWVYNAQ